MMDRRMGWALLALCALVSLLLFALQGAGLLGPSELPPCEVDPEYVVLFLDEDLLRMPSDGERIMLELHPPGDEQYVNLRYYPGQPNEQPLLLYKTPVSVWSDGASRPLNTTVWVDPLVYEWIDAEGRPLSYCFVAPKRVSDDLTVLSHIILQVFTPDELAPPMQDSDLR